MLTRRYYGAVTPLDALAAAGEDRAWSKSERAALDRVAHDGKTLMHGRRLSFYACRGLVFAVRKAKGVYLVTTVPAG